MSQTQNPEVKLARNTELAFTEAHLTYFNVKLCNCNMQCSSGFSARGGGSCPPLATPLDAREWPNVSGNLRRPMYACTVWCINDKSRYGIHIWRWREENAYVSHAHYRKYRAPMHSNFGTYYVCTHSTRNNQILQGDQTRREENFY